MEPLSLIQEIAAAILPVVLAITLHEAAHAFVAYRCGDSTAKMLGRLTLNPIAHIDLIGTILVPLLVGIFSQFHFIFGWAKPVPISTNQLRHPRRDIALVTAAGPLSNLLMAFIWTALFKLATLIHPEQHMAAQFLLYASRIGILINLVLAFLNLIPIPPPWMGAKF